MEKLYSSFKTTCLLICFLTLHIIAEAQVILTPINITTKPSYSQNFNTLPITSTSWVDASSTTGSATLPNWYALIDPVQTNADLKVPSTLLATPASQSKIDEMTLVNFQQESIETDRAFGFATGTTGNPIGYYGVRFKNNTDKDINEITINFDLEKIFIAPKIVNDLDISYQVGKTSTQTITSPDPELGVWTTTATVDDSELTWSITVPIYVPAGHEFFIRFVDNHKGGNSGKNDDDYAIDNFELNITKTSIPVLPVTLTSFKGSRSGDVVNLAWTTASEKDNDFFEVQQSEDGKSFWAVGEKVKGAGTTSVAQTYKAAVSAPSASTTYFRLKQVDFDGKFEYSKVIAVKGAGKATAQVAIGAYPNPTPGKVYVTSTGQDGPATVTLFHSSGRAVSQRQVEVEPGQPITLDLAGQASGVYYVQVQTDAGKSTTRVVKQ